MALIKINALIVLGAIIIDLLIMKYYTKKKTIPIKNNIMFLKIIKAIILMSLVNAISVFLGFCKATELNKTIHYIGNIIYLIIYEFSFLYFADYILWNCGRKKGIMDSDKRYFFAAFAILIVVMAVIKKDIFSIDSQNRYHLGRDYYLVNVFPAIVILSSIFIFLKNNRKNMSARNRGIFNGTVFLFLGVVSDNIINDVILVDFFFSLSMMIMYIASENPEYFRSENIRCFNHIAFKRFVNELIYRKERFYIYGIEIRNAATITGYRGTDTFYSGIKTYIRWLEERLPTAYIFYINNGVLNIIFLDKPRDLVFENICDESMKRPFKSCNGDVRFWIRKIYLDCSSDLCRNSSFIVNAEKYAISHKLYKSEDIYVDENVYKRIEYEGSIYSIVENSIKDDSLRIYIQPIYSPKSGKVIAGEILSRIDAGPLGIIMPSDFIPIAEKSGIIIELSYNMFEKACRFISDKKIFENGIKFLSVNCSPMQFQDLELADKLKKIADRYKVDFSNFRFEVTESYISNNDIMKIHIEKFKKYGAYIAMDDFGKGSSSLSRLREVDFDIIKLDMSLIWGYFYSEEDMLADVIDLLKKENFEIVAEGVETEDMAKVLSDMGCDYLQGYFFSRPVKAENLLSCIDEIDENPKKYIKNNAPSNVNNDCLEKKNLSEKNIRNIVKHEKILKAKKEQYERLYKDVAISEGRFRTISKASGILFVEYNIVNREYTALINLETVLLFTKSEFKNYIKNCIENLGKNHQYDENYKMFGGLYYLAYKDDIKKLDKARINLKKRHESYVNLRLLCGDSNYHWFNIKNYMSDNGEVITGCMRNIDFEKNRIDYFIDKSKKDPLTGIMNRNEAYARLYNYFDMGIYGAGAFILFDIDDFKNINDNYGHYTGDKVIKFFAEAISSVFENNEIVARFGGDEFYVFIKNIDNAQTAIKKAKEVQCVCKNKIIVDCREITISVSVGISYIEAGVNSSNTKELIQDCRRKGQ